MSKKVDQNQKEIVTALRRCGVSVVSLASVGKGCPDILCGVKGKNFFFEVKNPNVKLSERQLTPLEEQFHERWRGQIAIIHTWEEALEIIGI